ncbi:hypothetical protein ACHAQA_006845 [Verticillium albo-atrum]
MRGFYMTLGAVALQTAAVSGSVYAPPAYDIPAEVTTSEEAYPAVSVSSVAEVPVYSEAPVYSEPAVAESSAYEAPVYSQPAEESYPAVSVVSSEAPVYSEPAVYSSDVELTTSTVYATNVYTVTSCAPEVTNCPAGPHVTTETVALYTTVCPVTEVQSEQPKPTPTEWTTSTVYTTNVRTITSCAPEVTDCPNAPHVTTETIAVSTTICPVTEVQPPKTLSTQIPVPPYQSKPVAPKPEEPAHTTPVGTGSYIPPTATGTGPVIVPTAAAGRVGTGLVGAAAGLFVAALL